MTLGTRDQPIAPKEAGSGAGLTTSAAEVAIPSGALICLLTIDSDAAYVRAIQHSGTAATATNSILITPDSGGVILDTAGLTHISAKASANTPNLSIVPLR